MTSHIRWLAWAASQSFKLRLPLSLRRRLLFSGLATAGFFTAPMLVVVLASGGIKPLDEAVPAALAGLACAFLLGAVIFGAIPHFLARLMESSSGTFDFINRASLAVALLSILVGVVSSLLLIFGVSEALKPLLVAITLFAGAAAAMCSLKFFYTNRHGA